VGQESSVSLMKLNSWQEQRHSACPTIQALCGALQSSSRWCSFRGRKEDHSM